MPALKTTALKTALVLALFAPALNATEEFPYQAYVASDVADVVAGPGHRFYATAQLARGTPVTIYGEERSGWLAIQPPERSFSWVPAEYVEQLGEDQLGKVKQSIGAWIGTSVEHVAQHRQEVTLKAGELVHILAENKVTDHAGKDRSWLKIEPPAGEFRWIHLRDVSRHKPEPAETINESEQDTQPREPRRFRGAENAVAIREVDSSAVKQDRAIEPAQYKATAGAKATPSLSPDGFVARKRRAGDAVQEPQSQPMFAAGTSTSRSAGDVARRIESTARSSPAADLEVKAYIAGIPAGDVASQLAQLEVDLSLLLAQDKSQWNLAPIRQAARRLVEQGADPAARGQARLLLDKIKQIQDAFNLPDDAPVKAGGGQAVAGASANSPPVDRSLADPHYDAQGWLKPVVSKSGAKPVAEYAVVDAEGQPLSFVTPAPGLNLRSYLNRQVGVYGRRGYLEDLKKPHVVAERVIDLDRQWR